MRPHIAGRFVDIGGIEVDVEIETPEWHEALEWCRFHGIDPCAVPAESTITRDGRAGRIHYTEIVRDEDDCIVLNGDECMTVQRTEQGEGVLPFPDSLHALAATRDHDDHARDNGTTTEGTR